MTNVTKDSMKIILYLRVSSDDQIRNFSLDTQKDICTEYASRQGYEIDKIFREEGESAKTAKRPELIKMLDYCEQNKKEIVSVVVYRFDRMARNTLDHLAIKAKLALFGIKLESSQEKTDDSPSGRFMETLFAAMSQLDNEIRAERARNGLYKRFLAGMPFHVPLGYKMEEINGRKIGVPDDNFALVRRAWDLMETGTRSLTEIAKDMNSWGLTVKWNKTQKPITKQYASKLFQNRFYCGYLSTKTYSEEIRGVHDPMINEETYYRVQAIIQGKNPMPFGAKRRIVNEQFPLRGIVKCHVCGKNLVSASPRGRTGKKYPKYWCAGNCIPSVSVENITNLLLNKLTEIQPTQDVINAFTFYLKVKYESRLGALLANKKEAQESIREQKELMVNLVKGHLKGEYGDDVYATIKSQIENRLLTYNIVANDNTADMYDIEKIVNFTKALLSNLARAYEVSDWGQKRILLGSIYPSGLSFDGAALLNQEIGPEYQAVSQFTTGDVASCGLKFPTFETILSHLNRLILAYPSPTFSFAS